jgi:hypothetical protein
MKISRNGWRLAVGGTVLLGTALATTPAFAASASVTLNSGGHKAATGSASTGGSAIEVTACDTYADGYRAVVRLQQSSRPSTPPRPAPVIRLVRGQGDRRRG